ncbi:MAG: hypothetical protein ACRDCE_01555 [Cetobacterium sp.]|uniref:hypothetical protein n=1 Tax=Cetobacterium sp. TaxID=2071632 RepID=UPI003EE53C26
MSILSGISSAITGGGESFMQFANGLMGRGGDPIPKAANDANKEEEEDTGSFDFSFGGTARRGQIQQAQHAQIQGNTNYQGGQARALDPSIAALYSPFNPQQNQSNQPTNNFGGYAGF